MPAIRYNVPYEVRINARDLGSGKPVSNILYYRSGVQTDTTPPAYGDPIPGASSTATLLAAIKAIWEAQIVTQLSIKYRAEEYVMRAIVGKQYGSPYRLIAALVPGTPVQIVTSGPHGYATNDVVSVTNVTSPAAVNTNWTITVTGPTTFTLNTSSLAGTYIGPGWVQKVQGVLQLAYADKETLTSTQVGGVGTEAVALFAAASVRRLNGGVGKAWRSRLSLGPIAEDDVKDGAFITGAKVSWAAAFAAFNVSLDNGGSDSTGKFSFNVVVSKQLALAQPSPFTTATPWRATVNSFALRPNMGSMLRRKPSLTQAIT